MKIKSLRQRGGLNLLVVGAFAVCAAGGVYFAPTASRQGFTPGARATGSCAGDSNIAFQYSILSYGYEPIFSACGGQTVLMPSTITVYCDGQTSNWVPPSPYPEQNSGKCHNPGPQGIYCASGWLADSQACLGGNGQACCVAAPTTAITCENPCKAAPPPSSDCPGCDTGGRPIRFSDAELSYEVPLFPLEDPAFPDEFKLFWNSRDVFRRSANGRPLGLSVTHSLSLFLWKGADFDNVPKARVSLENGDTEGFYWSSSSSSWVAEGARGSILTALPFLSAGCPAAASLTAPDGTKYVFNDYCDGTGNQGTPITITRPNGSLLRFSLNASNLIAAVTDTRSGVQIAFNYAEGESTLGSVSAPPPYGSSTLQKYAFIMSNATLAQVIDPSGAQEWKFDVETSTSRLRRVKDAAGVTRNEWTYPSSTQITESGPGTAANTLTFTFSTSTSSATIAFVPAGPAATTVTNSYGWGSNPGGFARGRSRSASGDCPGCGATNLSKAFWTVNGVGTDDVRAVSNSNGNITVFADLANPTSHTAAFDAWGNALAINRGCVGSVSNPDCSSVTPYTTKYQYRTYLSSPVATHEWMRFTRPSVKGGATTVDDDRCFEGNTDRVALVHHAGYTASSLNGSLDSSTTNFSTKYNYSGSDVTQIDGPFVEASPAGCSTPTPPSTAPKIVNAYYAINEADACGSSNTYDFIAGATTGRLKSITRYGDNANLVTFYCGYDGAGRPTKIKNPDGTFTELSYDAKGHLLSRKADSSGLALLTSYAYDAAGRLVNVYLPRSTSLGRTGYKMLYDDGSHVVEVQHGYFATVLNPPSSVDALTSLEVARFSYDAWGNRLSTSLGTYIGGSYTEALHPSTTTFNAFNSAATLTRLAGPPAETYSYSYDALNRLASALDFQSDSVQYAWDRFGNLSSVSRKACTHADPTSSTACSDHNAVVTYTYDAALNISAVTLSDAVRAGSSQTQYVTDDFGHVVKIVSPDAGTLYAKYDATGRLTDFQEGRGKTFHFVYDRLGRLTQKQDTSTSPTDPTIYFCYDGYDFAGSCGPASNSVRAAGRLTAVKDKSGYVTYSYDGAGRLTQESRYFASSTFTTNYTLDANGNITTLQPPTGVSLAQTFDEADRKVRVDWSSGSGGNSTSGATVTAIEWFPFGGLKTWQPATTTRTFTVVRDPAGRITESKLTAGGTTPADATWAYGADGNVVNSGGGTFNINHDSMSRITLDRAPSGTTSTSTYSHDDRGNRVSQTTNGTTWNSTFSSASANRMVNGPRLVNYTYDNAGNVLTRVPMSSSFAIDDDGSVKSVTTVSGTTTYGRDWRGLRLTKSGAGGAGTFTFSATGELVNWTGPVVTLSCLSPAGTSKKIINYETYVEVGGFRLAVVLSHWESSCSTNPGNLIGSLSLDDRNYYFPDRLGVPRKVYRSSFSELWNADFDANGNPIAINDDADSNGVHLNVPFRLPGQYALTPAEEGPTTGTCTGSSCVGGLHENWHRIYDSVTGRYLEPDPLLSVLPDVNAYAYVGNAPLRLVDPQGLQEVGPILVGNSWFDLLGDSSRTIRPPATNRLPPDARFGRPGGMPKVSPDRCMAPRPAGPRPLFNPNPGLDDPFGGMDEGGAPSGDALLNAARNSGDSGWWNAFLKGIDTGLGGSNNVPGIVAPDTYDDPAFFDRWRS